MILFLLHMNLIKKVSSYAKKKNVVKGKRKKIIIKIS